MEASDEPTLVGTTIGRYRIVERIGEGGMGVVFRAVQEGLGRTVALKLIHRGLAAEPDVVTRFLREARIAGSLTNPNTVTIYDFGKAEDGSLYLAMEFIDGESVKKRLDRDGVFPPADVAAIGIQVCRSLLEAHRKDIAHRDLKPENILLSTTEDGTLRVTVLDYGLARSVNPSETGATAQVTQVGVILGTPEYMSPEQARGLQVDTRSDIYSLGIVLYEMLAGATPFSADSNISILASHVVQPPPLMQDVGKRVRPPPDLERLVLRMLEKEVEDRPADVLDVLKVLKTFLLREQPDALSQVFMDPTAPEDAEEDAPTRTNTPVMPEPTIDDTAAMPALSSLKSLPSLPSLPSMPSMPSLSTTPPPLEGDRTLVSQQAFPDDEDDDGPSITAPRARVPGFLDDALTTPATPALVARGSRLADDLVPPIDSSITADVEALPDRIVEAPAKKPPPRITQQLAGRRAVAAEAPPLAPASSPRTFEDEDAAHRELASRVTVAPEESRESREPRQRHRIPIEHQETAQHMVPSARHTTEMRPLVSPGRLHVQMAIVGGLAVLTGVLLALWWTRAPGDDDGLPEGYTAKMPPAEGWAGTYDTSRGPLLLDQQGESLAGSLGAGNDAVRLAGQVDGMAFRFAWASRDTGGPITAQGSGRGEMRWYLAPDGHPVLRATLGYGTASVGAGALWAKKRR